MTFVSMTVVCLIYLNFLFCIILFRRLIKSTCYGDPMIRRRRKDMISLYTSQLEKGVAKHDEKKRRQKQAHLRKSDKKDAFARGGSSGH